MAKIQLSKSNRLSPRLVLTFIVATVLTFLLLASVINISQKYFHLRKDIKDLKTDQASLEKKENQLADTNSYLTTSEGQEQALRDKYNVVKPGEGMIIITPSDDESVAD